MEQFWNREPDFQSGGLIFAALCLLLLPLRWLLALVLAAAVHEWFHLLLIWLQKIKIQSIRIGSSGTIISTAPMTQLQELLSAAAGPLGSFCLLLFLNSYPELAFCGLAQGIFNLLPIYPSDGGRILRCILELSFPEKAATVEKAVKWTILILLTLVGILLILLFTRWFWLIFLGWLLMLRPSMRKIPCKAGPLALQ